MSVTRSDLDTSSPDTTCSVDQDAMPDSSGSSNKVRQRLKPWLEAKINSGRFPGLQWVDKEQGIFRITWKHGGRADWSEQDALIFKEWAIHTGRFREGTDTPDWPSWKTRLRCALNKLPDIQEMKDRSCYDEPNPYRVYKFVDRKGSGSSSPSYREHPSPADDGCISQTVFHQQMSRPSVIQTSANIPTILSEVDSNPNSLKQELGPGSVGGCDDAKMSSLGSDLENISIRDLVPMDGNTPSLTNISVDSNINSTEPMDMEAGSLKHDQGGAGGYQQHQQMAGAGAGVSVTLDWMNQPGKHDMWLNHPIKSEPVDCGHSAISRIPPAEHEIFVTLKFRDQTVDQYQINNQHGCRIYYGKALPPEILQQSPDGVWGDPLADQIAIPYTPGQLESRLDTLTTKLLTAMDRGFNIYVSAGCIYVHRRCKTMIFAAPPNMDEKVTVKVERTNDPVKIFDLYGHFLPALKRFKHGEGPKPSAQVVVALGQNFRADLDPYSNLLISVTVGHAQAHWYLAQHMPECPEPEISRSNEYDQYAHYVQENVEPLMQGMYGMAQTTTH